ncbi:hypothetical protein REMIM1_PE00249 (plasmid) [Rhizobium etli bv. mimosae str. Mim1]|nr:hypothetical protein REMIM1_PE00249 [Rhizobium etli bv. mimosae str. Mim1]
MPRISLPLLPIRQLRQDGTLSILGGLFATPCALLGAKALVVVRARSHLKYIIYLLNYIILRAPCKAELIRNAAAVQQSLNRRLGTAPYILNIRVCVWGQQTSIAKQQSAQEL